MPETTYQPPLDRLLTYGDFAKIWQKQSMPDYVEELQLTAEHIPDLIRMATDEVLQYAASESLEVWAPVHAWWALGQLQAEAAIEPLLSLLDELVEDDDWVGIVLPRVFGMVGTAAIPPLETYVLNRSLKYHARSIAGDALVWIAKNHPEARTTCIDVLIRAVEEYKQNTPVMNGFLLASLLDLKAVEAAPTIAKAFAADRIDTSIAGDWGDVQVELGLKAREELPPKVDSVRQMIDYFNPNPEAPKREAARGFATPTSSKKKKKRK